MLYKFFSSWQFWANIFALPRTITQVKRNIYNVIWTLSFFFVLNFIHFINSTIWQIQVTVHWVTINPIVISISLWIRVKQLKNINFDWTVNIFILVSQWRTRSSEKLKIWKIFQVWNGERWFSERLWRSFMTQFDADESSRYHLYTECVKHNLGLWTC